MIGYKHIYVKSKYNSENRFFLYSSQFYLQSYKLLIPCKDSFRLFCIEFQNGICKTIVKSRTLEIWYYVTLKRGFYSLNEGSFRNFFLRCTKTVQHPSIHPLSTAYPKSGRRGSSFSSKPQTSLSPATLANSPWGIPRPSQAREEI